jgi:predicted molibdopterin-dependent oxidoreductase YjgC
VVTRKFAAVKQENGGEAFAVLTSAKCTNEENFLVNKLTRQVLGTNSIDHCARL